MIEDDDQDAEQTKASGMDARDLKELVERNLTQAIGAPGSIVAEERLRNLEAYLAEPVGDWAPPEVADRSDFVATDVADTVEWMLPSLLRIFASSRKSIELVARHPRFEAQSQLASEVLRHHFWDKSNGFQVLYDFLKDGLLQKVGFVYVRWEDRAVEITESYRGITEGQLAMIAASDDVEIVEQAERQEMVSLDGVNQQPITVYDVKVKRESPDGCCVIDAVPPEEMRISATARYNDRDARFIAQATRRTRDALRAEGYNAEGAAGEQYSEEETARAQINRTQYGADDDADEGGELVRYVDAYPLVDADRTGTAERLRVVLVGDEVAEDEKVDDHPFVWWCPVPMPHVFFGHCPADHALKPQRLHTNIVRAIEDNLYLQVNGRTEVAEDGIGKDTINDLLDVRPGGLVRTKKPGTLTPLVQPDLSAGAWNMAEWVEQWCEKRTGFSRISKGLSPDTLNTETATGVLELTERADMRTELVARHAANAIEWMLTKVLKCLSQYQDVSQSVRINGQWVDYDPREWANQFTVRVNVGLGAGNKDRRAAGLMQLNGIQANMIGASMLPREAGVALARDLAQSLGEDSPEKYFPDPLPQQPPPPDPKVQAEQIRMQDEAHKFQAQTAFDASEAQKQRDHEFRMKAIELEAKQREVLVTLAAGVLSAKAQQGAPGAMGPGPNLINGTNLDQTAQAADLSGPNLEAVAAAIQQLAGGVMPSGGFTQ